MKCPNCGVEGAAGALECAGCGVIFAKFKKKLDELKPASSHPANRWKGRAVALAILVAWLIGFSLYYQRRVAEMRVNNPAGPPRR